MQKSDKLLDEAIRIWQPQSGHSLGSENVRRITGNLVGFFTLLAEWDSAEQGVGDPSNLTVLPDFKTDDLGAADKSIVSHQDIA